MAFDIENAQSMGAPTRSGIFKDKVRYDYFKADEAHPRTFRILPAFPEHEGEIDKISYSPAAEMVKGRSVINDWLFTIKASRPFIKGSTPIVSRSTLIERNADGSRVIQTDPLYDVQRFIEAHDEWKYIIEDQGKWGDPNRIPAKMPKISNMYVMNVLTFDDEKPSVKLGIVSSWPAIGDLIRKTSGQEGYAIKPNLRATPEALQQNPSAVFEYGDITDPNGAPLFRFCRGLSNDGKKAYRITVVTEVDPSTGISRVSMSQVGPNELQWRCDLAHPETYVNIPDVNEQIKQICQACSGRNADGYHEWDMIRMALPDYAHLVPAVPAAPAAHPMVGYEKPVQPVTQPVAQPAMQPIAQFVAKPVMQPTLRPVTQSSAPVAQPAAQPAAQPVAQPVAAPVAQPAAQPVMQPVRQSAGVPQPQSFAPAAAPAAAPAGVAGEEVSEDDWLNEYNAANAGG